MRSMVKIALAAALCAAGASAAVAGGAKQTQNKDGLIINYYPAKKVYCLRASSAARADSLGLRLHAVECGTADRWARLGLIIGRRGDAARPMAAAR
jgi:hypothetical protein